MKALPLFLALFTLGCAATETRDESFLIPTRDSIGELSARLVETARLRTDLSGMRVCVHDIRSRTVPDGRSRAIGDALEREFTVALASDLNLLDVEYSGPDAPTLAVDGLDEVSEHHGATHLLVGSFQERTEDMVVTVRLIDASSHLIVAAARGAVPIADFDALGSWTPEIAEVSPRVEPTAPPVAESIQPVATENEILALVKGPMANPVARPVEPQTQPVTSARGLPPAAARRGLKPARKPTVLEGDFADELPVSKGPAGRRLKSLHRVPAKKEQP